MQRFSISRAVGNGCTFTPLAGMSEVVMGFLPAEMQIPDGA
jgi:phage terminase large subunit-like protein